VANSVVESVVLTQRNSVDQRSSTMKTMTKRQLKIQVEVGPKLKMRAEMEPRMSTWLATGRHWNVCHITGRWGVDGGCSQRIEWMTADVETGAATDVEVGETNGGTVVVGA
jgi:hypothetical protein